MQTGAASNDERRTRMADPIHQFEIHKIFSLGHIGGQEIAFTNSSAYMFGAVAVVSGHIRGLTNTMPLQVEIMYNEYAISAAFAVASLLALLALVTLALKSFLEWRHGDKLASRSGH